MKSENKEIFIPGPSGRIQAKYFQSKQKGASVALILAKSAIAITAYLPLLVSLILNYPLIIGFI